METSLVARDTLVSLLTKLRKRFSCSYCEKQFTKKYHLERHVTSVHLHIRYHCKICPKSFASKEKLKHHIQVKHEKTHNETNYAIACDICGKRFSCKDSLRIHLKVIHENLKPFTCDHCDKQFNTKTAIKTFMLIVNYMAFDTLECVCFIRNKENSNVIETSTKSKH